MSQLRWQRGKLPRLPKPATARIRRAMFVRRMGRPLPTGSRAQVPTVYTLLVGLCVLASWSTWPAYAQTNEVVVEVDAKQHATVVGRSASLRTLLGELCWRGGATLEFYDAVDRPVGGSYRDVLLVKLVGRLLSDESYVAEATVDPSTGTERLVRLRVLGDPATAMARRASGAGAISEAPLQVPPALLQTALTAPKQTDPSEKQTALAMIEARIAGDARQLEAFLTTDSRLIAQAIARFDRAAQSLREARGHYSDPRITAKLDEIIAALATMGSHQ